VARIIHVSDLHQQLDWGRKSYFSTGWRGALGRFELHGLGRLKRFEGVRARLEQLVDDLHAFTADHLVVTGDVSALGHEDEIGPVEELLRPLLAAGRMTVIPGNHDRYTDKPGARVFERFFKPWLTSDLPELAVDGRYPFVRLVGESLAFIGLDSTHVSGLAQYFFGRIGKPQLEAARKALAHPKLAGRTVFVLVHHGPLGPSGKFDWVHSGLLDAKELLALVHERPAVLLHGHSHERFWHRAHEGRPHVVGAGSSTEKGREGYYVLEFDDHAELEAHAYMPGRKRAP
jgi:3',5'-cyclic AMP phosphodiesterase CpdA